MAQSKLVVSKFQKNQVNENNDEYLNTCEQKNFGIIKLHAIGSKQYCIPLHLILTIDVSTSMDEECMWKNKRYSKLDYVKATLKSIFKYLKTEYNNRDILISLISFSDSADIIKSYINLNETELQNLFDIVDKLEAVGCTNIYDALKKATTLYDEFEVYLNTNIEMKEKYSTPQHFKHVNILLTDGEITVGIENPKALAEVAQPKYIELQLLGYGSEHDSKLLKTLEALTQGEYRFVDSFESAGAVYGDVLSSMLHPAWQDINIQIENGLIYDYKEHKWSNSLQLPRIGDDCEKVLSCRLFNEPKIMVNYVDITENENIISKQVKSLVSNQDENKVVYEDTQDIRCNWLRQLTIELMNEIQNFKQENNLQEDQRVIQNRQMTPMRNNRNNIRGNVYVPRRVFAAQGNQNKLNMLVQKVEKLLKYIEQYELDMAKELTDKNIELLKDLRDDLTVAKKSLTKTNDSTNDLYLNSRLSSQGAQRAYNTYINEDLGDDIVNYPSVGGTNTQASNVRTQARISSHASPYAQRAMNQVAQLSQDIINSSVDFDNEDMMDIDD